jgi:hypothetical protein
MHKSPKQKVLNVTNSHTPTHNLSAHKENPPCTPFSNDDDADDSAIYNMQLVGYKLYEADLRTHQPRAQLLSCLTSI